MDRLNMDMQHNIVDIFHKSQFVSVITYANLWRKSFLKSIYLTQFVKLMEVSEGDLVACHCSDGP